ncbi:MAG: imidazolonepropionase [Fusobacteriaceae bacterium]
MRADLVIEKIGQLATGRGVSPLCGEKMKDIDVLKDAYIAIKDEIIIGVGVGECPSQYIGEDTKRVDVNGKLVTPGFVDCHTHLVHGGSRENEFQMKLDGVPYLEILERGGGILSSVKATRDASFHELAQKAKISLDRMLLLGVTTIEAKSGYGLDLETELKQLEVAKFLNKTHPIDLISTYMGAHAIPEEFKRDPEEYVEFVMRVLPIVKENNLAEFCDIFCENNIFSVEDSRKILLKAKKLGYDLRIHADEIICLGGAELAGEIGAKTAEHLLAASDEGLKSLVENGVTSVVLPGTSFNLGKNYAQARKIIQYGGAVAIATDYNPGSCPTENLQLVMQIAGSQMKLSPKEILSSVTLNGAWAVNRALSIGTIEVGKKADINIFNSTNLDFIIYHFGINFIESVYKNGKLVVKNQQLCYLEE